MSWIPPSGGKIPPRPEPETPEPFDEKTYNAFRRIGFDDTRAQLLMAAGVNVDRATALVCVRKCPLDLALEILL